METPAVASPLVRVERQLYEQLIGFSNPQQIVYFTRNGNIFSIKLDSSWHQTLWSVKYISELGLFTKREPTRVEKLYGPWEKALFLSCHRLESCGCLERQVPLCRPPFKCPKSLLKSLKLLKLSHWQVSGLFFLGLSMVELVFLLLIS